MARERDTLFDFTALSRAAGLVDLLVGTLPRSCHRPYPPDSPEEIQKQEVVKNAAVSRRALMSREYQPRGDDFVNLGAERHADVT